MSNRQAIKVIQRFLRSHATSTSINKTWELIVRDWGIGTLSGDNVFITEKERETLRAHCKRTFGVDPLITELQGDRMLLAKQGANEKISNINVFANMVQLARPGKQPIHLASGDAHTPPGSLLSVDLATVDFHGVSHVIIVENGMAFRCWDKIIFPCTYVAPLFIYRGHGINSRAVMDLIADNNLSFKKVGFFDLDPAGICLGAKKSGFDELLIPDFTLDSVDVREQLKLHIKNNSFLDQCTLALSQQHLLTEIGQELLQKVVDLKWSLTQETMISLAIRLKIQKI